MKDNNLLYLIGKYKILLYPYVCKFPHWIIKPLGNLVHPFVDSSPVILPCEAGYSLQGINVASTQSSILIVSPLVNGKNIDDIYAPVIRYL